MNIKAIITAALVIGSTSLAMAQPAPEVRDHRYDAPIVQTTPAPEARDHRFEPIVQTAPAPIAQPPVVASWGHPPIFKVLSSNDKLNDGQEYIRVSRFMRPMKLLKLQATGGKTSVKDVVIKFANGTSQTVCLNQTLSGNQATSIDLSGNYRNVVSVYITGSASRRASFELLGA